MRLPAAGVLLASVFVAAASASLTASDGAVIGTASGGEPCTGFDFVSFLPTPLVQPYAPDYPVYLVAPAVSQIVLIVLHCPSLTVGNVTESDVTIGAVDSAIDGGGAYRFETFVQEPSPNAVQGLLEDGGWTVTPAAFSEPHPGILRLDADCVHYTVATTPSRIHIDPFNPVGPMANHTSFALRHAIAANGDHLQVDENFNSGSNQVGPGVLFAEGGVLGGMTSGAPLPGVVSDLDAWLTFRVHAAESV